VLGAVCWVVAQGFEATQYAGDLRPGHIHAADLTDAQLHAATTTTGYYASMVSEELLEMSGSLCFGIAALIAVRALLARRASDA